MATKTWNGSDLSWNTLSNWSPSGVPTSADDVVFDATSTQACTCDVAIDVLSLVVASGYSGKLDFADSAYSHAIGGDFTCDGTGEVDCGTSTLTIAGNFDSQDQTTWTRGTSTVVLTGTTKTIAASTISFTKSIQIENGTGNSTEQPLAHTSASKLC
jgi:hypothetical protein